MGLVLPKSPSAGLAKELVESLQRRLVNGLEALSSDSFVRQEWLRDEGSHGGGNRYSAPPSDAFNRASVNFSCVHYDDNPKKRLGSATALSAIVHPANPYVPSVHIHISWTEMRDGTGYWRMMADLNPSLPDPSDTDR